jgi:hypothetical protein
MIKASGIPLVVTWKLFLKDAELPTVSFDNYRGGLLAMEHLIALGHRKIGLVCGRTELNDRARERQRAYEDSIIVCGLKGRRDANTQGRFRARLRSRRNAGSFAAPRTANGCVLRERRSSHRRSPRMRGTWGARAHGYVPCRLRRSSHCKIRAATTDDHSCPCATHGGTRGGTYHRSVAHRGARRQCRASDRARGAQYYGARLSSGIELLKIP